MKNRCAALVILALASSVSAIECGSFDSSQDIGANDLGIFLQDRIGCALSNLMAPGAMGTLVIVFFAFVVLLLFYALLSRRLT